MEFSQIADDWVSVLAPIVAEPFFRKLERALAEDRAKGPVYPPSNLVFRALLETPLKSVKVIIVGQDPYHGAGQAEGLSFSVPSNVRKPPSLDNILKELSSDLGIPTPSSGSLVPWAQQGVLLLNSVLTVRANEPGSHSALGWQIVTDAIISSVSNERRPKAFLLWGAYAQKKRMLINLSKHYVQESAHPSPYSAHLGFFGSRPFTNTNEFLVQAGQDPVDWRL